MHKKLLIINSQSAIDSLSNFLEELVSRNYFLIIATYKPEIFSQQNKKEFLCKKVPKVSNFSASLFFLFFILLFPISFPLLFFTLLLLKFNEKIKAIICCDYLEKIIITPFAKIIGLKVIWLENPNFDYNLFKKNKVSFFIFRVFSSLAKIIALNNFSKQQLNLNKIGGKNIDIISLGIKLNNYQNQENIFSQIAEAEQKNKNKNFFTIGTAVNLKNKQRIENLFQAAKKCITVIPNLQLIIIGEGEERKNLLWTAKKMEIDNIVWFIGEQKLLKKWLISFDIFISTCNTLSLDDINITLQAMASGLPILGQQDIGLEDLVKNNINGYLVNMDNNEELAQSIIKLKQNKNLKKHLGQTGKNIVETNFSIQSMVNNFEKIID